MLAVSNTSPISNLASIGRLDLMRQQFPLLFNPGAVSLELAAHPDAAASGAIRAVIQDGWIGISVTGTLGVLLHAKRARLIDSVKPEIRKLRSIARFFIAPSLETKVLAAADE